MKSKLNDIPKDIFIVSTGKRDIIHLPNIGRFCKCGCGRRLEGKTVTRMIKGKNYNYRMPVRKDQVFVCSGCKNKYYNRNKKNKYSTTDLMCRIRLPIINDKKPYRELWIYHANKQKTLVKVTPKMKELWQVLELFSRYKYNNSINLVNQITPTHKNTAKLSITA